MSVTFNVHTATGPQLLAFFNENTGGAKVTKFRDRTTAEKRVQRLVDEMKAEELVEDMGIKSPKEAAQIIAAALAPTFIEAEAVYHSPVTKPWQRAKVIVCDMVAKGVTSRKEIIAACVAAGIKPNTADGAHYALVVQGRAK